VHELSLVAWVVDAIAELAVRERFERVATVSLDVGALCAASPDALSFCFDVAAKGTAAEGAALTITVVPARGTCGACGAAFDVVARGEPCASCGSFDLSVEGGDGVTIKELVVD
jgi:hydrogenase nickel incorporation protein HypA/HybF